MREKNSIIPEGEIQSKVIEFLRFPIIVGVIFTHNYSITEIVSGVEFGSRNYMPVYQSCAELFSQIIGRVAVPFFFLVSGFLFFLNVDFNKQSYIRKIRNRTKTLLVPYLFWSALALIIFFIISNISPLSIFFNIHPDFSLRYILDSLWQPHGMIVYPFWYIRNLIVITIFSPLVYFYVKKLGVYGIIFLGILWLFWDCLDIRLGASSIKSVFFFFGAWLSINNKNLIRDIEKWKTLSFTLYPLVVIADLLTKGYTGNPIIHKVGIIFGILFWLNIGYCVFKNGKNKVNKFLASSSFFVFAIHEPILQTLLVKLFFVWLKPNTDGEFTFHYFITVTLTIFIALICYYLLKRLAPTFTNIIVGGRIKSSH